MPISLFPFSIKKKQKYIPAIIIKNFTNLLKNFLAPCLLYILNKVYIHIKESKTRIAFVYVVGEREAHFQSGITIIRPKRMQLTIRIKILSAATK